MSYKASARMRPIFCLLHLVSDQAMASGDPVGWTVQTGTLGHGVTVASGVITLPIGHQWFAQSQIACTSVTPVELHWYENNTASTTFAKTGISLVTTVTAGSNIIAHCYIDASSASVDLELRANGTMTADSECCFLLLTGYPT